MSTSLPPLAIIAGPTASGKSALALAWAARTGGVIVNADASQLYREIPITSAAPTAAERQIADHRAYGACSVTTPCSAAAYAALARTEIAAVHAEGRIPLLVGGTGLYLRTLLDGIAPVPPIDPAIRAAIRTRPVSENRADLERFDPAAAARLNPNDTTRIARALEVVRSTGRTLADWQAHKEGGIANQVTLHPLLLLPPRDWLNPRIDRRFADIFDTALDEIRALLDLDPSLPAMRAIGVPEIAAYLCGELTRGDAIAAGQLATRRYAKRQYTWFANQPPADWPRFTEPLDAPGALDRALALL
jgi:tRNA dimethylallyltransferase